MQIRSISIIALWIDVHKRLVRYICRGKRIITSLAHLFSIKKMFSTKNFFAKKSLLGDTHFVAGKNSFHPKHILCNVPFSVIVAIKIIRIITAKSIVSIIKILFRIWLLN